MELNQVNREKLNVYLSNTESERGVLLYEELLSFRQYVEDMNKKVAEMASPDNLMKLAENFIGGPGGLKF